MEIGPSTIGRPTGTMQQRDSRTTLKGNQARQSTHMSRRLVNQWGIQSPHQENELKVMESLRNSQKQQKTHEGQMKSPKVYKPR